MQAYKPIKKYSILEIKIDRKKPQEKTQEPSNIGWWFWLVCGDGVMVVGSSAAVGGSGRLMFLDLQIKPIDLLKMYGYIKKL